MEILAVSCIHNDVENMFALVDQLAKQKFDVVVFPGDFTDLNLPKGFTRTDIAKLVLSELGVLGKPIVTVPGSWDKEIIDYLDRAGVSVHGAGKTIDGVGFYGYGGARTPFGTPFEPSDSEIENGLVNAYKQVKDAKLKVQVTHMPPFKTPVDMIPSGAHVGSEAVRRFIERNKPQLSISAHIHEGKGVAEMIDTTLVNPGRLPEGSCALISLGEAGVKARMLNLIEEVNKSQF